MQMNSWIGQLREIKATLKPAIPNQSLQKTPSDNRKGRSTEKEHVACPICSCLVRSDRVQKHITKTHKNTIRGDLRRPKSGSKAQQVVFVQCPQCGVRLKENNLSRHVRRRHTRKNLKSEKKRDFRNGEKKIKPSHKQIMTQEEAKQLRAAMNETELLTNKEIAAYIKRNPLKEEVGKFGLPQDKYRWGFFGSRSMQYDVWRKG